MQNKKIFILSTLGLFVFNFVNAQPVCPVCVVAVAGGLGLSRWLGINDVITSIWIGAFLIAITVWTYHWLGKKGWNFRFYRIATFLFYYLFTIVPLYYMNMIGLVGNTILGVDKVLFGIFLGTFIFMASVWFNLYLKKINNGKGYFPYQKVIVPFGILILSSLILYFII